MPVSETDDTPSGTTPPFVTAPGTTAPEPVDEAAAAPLDLAGIERDLAAVEAALPRLDDGSYWLDETTGAEIPDDVLADDPVARSA